MAVHSKTFWRFLKMTRKQQAVMMIGEIGGPQEAEAAEFIRDNIKKPIIAYIAGLSAPKGKRMGHAGANHIRQRRIGGGENGYSETSGVVIAPNPSEMGNTAPKCWVNYILLEHSYQIDSIHPHRATP